MGEFPQREAPDLCEKKIPLRRKRCGLWPVTLSIRFTSSLSILLLPNRTGRKEERLNLGGGRLEDAAEMTGITIMRLLSRPRPLGAAGSSPFHQSSRGHGQQKIK